MRGNLSARPRAGARRGALARLLAVGAQSALSLAVGGPGPATSFSAAWTAACSVWTRAHASWSTLAGLVGCPGGGSGWDTPPRLLWPPPRARTGSCTSGTSSRGLLPAREMAAPDLGRPFPRSTGTRRAQSQASSSGTSRGCRPAPGQTPYPKIKVSFAEKLKALRCRLKCTKKGVRLYSRWTASSTSWACSLLCCAEKPVAVAAAAGLPAYGSGPSTTRSMFRRQHSIRGIT